MGPEGRIGLGLGDGEGAATTSPDCTGGAFGDVSLQAEDSEPRQTRTQHVKHLCSVTLIFFMPYRSNRSNRSYYWPRLQPDFEQQSGRPNDEERIKPRVYHLV